MIMWQHRYYHAIWMVMNIAVPAATTSLIDRAWGHDPIAGLLRVVLVHQGTSASTASATSSALSRGRAKTPAETRWISVKFTFGEGYHNYHHTLQRTTATGSSGTTLIPRQMGDLDG